VVISTLSPLIPSIWSSALALEAKVSRRMRIHSDVRDYDDISVGFFLGTAPLTVSRRQQGGDSRVELEVTILAEICTHKFDNYEPSRPCTQHKVETSYLIFSDHNKIWNLDN
jgi:hypothetical protein